MSWNGTVIRGSGAGEGMITPAPKNEKRRENPPFLETPVDA